MSEPTLMSPGQLERALLKSALLACDHETQQFIQPLLSIPAVQHLLHALHLDSTRSIQDWIWEPVVYT